MDALELDMEIQNIVKLGFLDGMVSGKQGFHLFVHFFGLGGLFFAYSIGQTFVVSHGEP